MTQVVIPYKPRYPQTEIHSQLESHRFAVLVAHRRMGKTVLSVNHLIKRAIVDRKERGFYAYLAPFRNQAEQIAWSYLKHYTAPIPGLKVNEQKLAITLPNGATIRIFGADNPDALRGAYFDGCVLDEVAQMKPEVWGEILRPALADRHGWAVFIGTPKGVNLFSQMYDKALERMAAEDPEWVAMLYSVDRTHVIPDKELEALKLEMSENEFRQEFMCDFNAAADNVLIPIDDVRLRLLPADHRRGRGTLRLGRFRHLQAAGRGGLLAYRHPQDGQHGASGPRGARDSGVEAGCGFHRYRQRRRRRGPASPAGL